MTYPILSNLAQVAAGAAMATIAVFALRAMLLAIDARLQARRPPQA
jgi:hypothetical protein